MKVYILCSHAGHYQGAFKTRKEAEEYADNEMTFGYRIFVEVL